jgi:hypothetical protein
LQLGEKMTTKKTKKETEVKAPKTDASTQTAQTTPPQAQPATDLTIADLKNIGTIIDVASTRGAFRANEMATVGLVYNKLQMFLAKVAPETKPEENKTAEAPAAAGK